MARSRISDNILFLSLQAQPTVILNHLGTRCTEQEVIHLDCIR